MRLFAAVEFSPELREALLQGVSQLRRQSSGGNFTKPENLHLTLAFIGETSRVSEAKAALDACSGVPFTIFLGKSGRFGELYWAGLEDCPELEALAAALRRALADRGFDIDPKPFRPHITLARQLRAPEPARLELPEAKMTVEKISLMRSDRIDGRLQYRRIHQKTLG